MLVWVQGSPFHIAAGSHPVQEALGSQNSLYRGQIQKLLQCCRENCTPVDTITNDCKMQQIDITSDN